MVIGLQSYTNEYLLQFKTWLVLVLQFTILPLFNFILFVFLIRFVKRIIRCRSISCLWINKATNKYFLVFIVLYCLQLFENVWYTALKLGMAHSEITIWNYYSRKNESCINLPSRPRHWAQTIVSCSRRRQRLLFQLKNRWKFYRSLKRIALATPEDYSAVEGRLILTSGIRAEGSAGYFQWELNLDSL